MNFLLIWKSNKIYQKMSNQLHHLYFKNIQVLDEYLKENEINHLKKEFGCTFEREIDDSDNWCWVIEII